ncbi:MULTISPECIES: Na+/H+ antiporter NhaA [unclassified Pseudodesulfovibrio]|uniref:Na+/H+ antiporter NhaA n=1 Tax=unclassified Pseudodesulfovibrio TaxID=2661612 RepID=UPI000FEBEAD9|nr:MULTISPECIES: Na+/H+ antiporter NhaA [unclassified Pseudodesulfovibrio]MCJ2165780.1 Na+/H+ antiporter NhaA [Pseudodesulfovibrio sp. S3-i]RWU02783.1 Na+/H+ antiporter NhaA [Pseudodesulfovibrio sp. S3]
MSQSKVNPLPANRVLNSFDKFFKMEAAGGIALMVCTIAALVWANSPWAESYHALWQTRLTVGIGNWVLSKAAILWINDGLMAVFFFLVGLEIKRELMVGGLSTMSQTIMPVAAAVGGMAVPALFFFGLNAGQESAAGWGIPMATDIAFALGIMSLLGSRVPVGLKIFLTAVAIVDDIGAILVIAVFYTTSLDLTALAVGLGGLCIMAALNLRWGIRHSIPYLVLGVIVWFAFLMSGIHATIAGVLAAMTIPAGTRMNCSSFVEELRHAAEVFELAITPGKTVLTNREQQVALHSMEHAYEAATTPLQNIEHALHPWVSFAIMPIFALANAGVAMDAGVLRELFTPVSLGIFFGLVVGKQVGVTGACWVVNKLGLAPFPDRTTLMHLWGAACLAGVGFTMSIFIANLAFDEGTRLVELSKIAILFASLVSGVLGYMVLKFLAPDISKEGVG